MRKDFQRLMQDITNKILADAGAFEGEVVKVKLGS